MKTLSRTIVLTFIILFTPVVYFIMNHDKHRLTLWLEYIGMCTLIAVFLFIAVGFMNKLPEEKDDNGK